MKITNLDQFKTVDHVTLGGKAYEIYARPIEDFLNTDMEKQLEASKTTQDKSRLIVEFIKYYSNFPEEVLVKQDMGVLNAILKMINGVDVEAELKAQIKAEGKAKGNA